VRALIEIGDGSGAQHQAELGLRKFPGDAELYELKGRALETRGLRNAAETAYENALRFAPDRASVILALARVRCELGLPASALQLLTPRLDSGKSSAEEFLLAASAHHALQHHPQAFVCYDRAFSLANPTLAHLLQAATMYGDPAVRKQDARAAVLAGEWANRALALDPQATMAHVVLGWLAEDAGLDARAAQFHRRAVETDPASVVALSALAAVQARRGEIEDSKAMAERALAIERDPAKRAELEKLARPTTP
jgi:tetratricopeptide (TPR) repeat protein